MDGVEKMTRKHKQILLYSTKTQKFQGRKVLTKNLARYDKVKITPEDRKTQKKLLFRKRVAYKPKEEIKDIPIPQIQFYRTMKVWNYVGNTDKIAADYPLFMEVRITRINITPQDLRKVIPTMNAIKNNLLLLFRSFRASLQKGVLLEKERKELQLTIDQALNEDHVEGRENEEISEGEVNTQLLYFDKYVRIMSPQVGEREYNNEAIETALKTHKKISFEVDIEGRVFIKNKRGL